jgi:hypothetical protein
MDGWLVAVDECWMAGCWLAGCVLAWLASVATAFDKIRSRVLLILLSSCLNVQTLSHGWMVGSLIRTSIEYFDHGATQA